MSSERRISKRFTVVNLELLTQGTDYKVGQVVNLSEGGMLVYSNKKFDPDSIQKFSIAFNRTINGQINFDFDARIAWIKEGSPNENKYSMGLEFAQNPEIQNTFVQQMIKVFGA
ncbi:MAG: PilZ domain-containing protein [Anaerolineae bacterium]|nr:PilZ domain-containing protein [Anaerolineae bacterium]